MFHDFRKYNDQNDECKQHGSLNTNKKQSEENDSPRALGNYSLN
jgi:hypothetical protein